MKLPELKEITKAVCLPEPGNLEITELAIDSRKIQNPEQCLFIALSGTFRDGHQFIKAAWQKGVRTFLVNRIPEENFPDTYFLQVDNTLSALQKIATAHREKFHFPVIGITGSNGKTIIKEWLFQLLADDFHIVRNPKSYNSQIGVPLSIWQIKDGDELGIFEAGISQPGEMENLTKIIRPDMGIFTNIGDAHSEGFLSTKQKIREKLLLFRQVKKLFYCKDHADLQEEILLFQNQLKGTGTAPELCGWSRHADAPFRILETHKHQRQTTIKGYFQQREVSIQIPFEDEASVENAIHCWNVLLHLGISDEEIAKNMQALHSVAMRLERVHGINNSLLINDTYNSDVTSLQIALDVLVQQKQYTKKTVILSDLLQISRPDDDLYEKVAGWIAGKNIQRLIGIGPAISKHKSVFRKHKNLRSIFFKSTTDFLKKFHLITFKREAILLKGARVFRFEKIEHLLEQKIHKTVLEINLSAIIHNLKAYKNLLPPEVKMMAMVKAYSYGSGSYEIALALQEAGIDYLGVAYVDEGVMLRKAGIQTPIMVMNPESGAYDRMIFWKLEPEIYSLEALHSFQDIARILEQKNYPIHLKLDTGMHRLGFLHEDLAALKSCLKEQPGIRVVSIFSHLAGSGAKEFDEFTRQQVQLFRKMAADIASILPQKPLLHILNSAGITRHPQYHFDMVRLGLGLYGIDSSGKIQKKLLPTGKLKTTIAQIHTIKTGESVGYDRRGKTLRDSRIATVNIGYADGYFRDFGNENSYMLVHGQKAPVIGSICMDMCMLDVTDIPEARAGDEAIVFGESPHLNQLAKWANTIPYEIMTGISQRVNRVYVEE